MNQVEGRNKSDYDEGTKKTTNASSRTSKCPKRTKKKNTAKKRSVSDLSIITGRGECTGASGKGSINVNLMVPLPMPLTMVFKYHVNGSKNTSNERRSNLNRFTGSTSKQSLL